MRKYFLLFALAIFLSLMATIMIFLLNPFNEEAVLELARAENIRAVEEMRVVLREVLQQGLIWDYLNLRNVIVVSVLIGGALVSAFAFLHLVFERIFLRRFFEKVSLIVAIRRGVVLSVTLVGLVLLNLIGTEWFISLAFVVAMIGIELIITRITEKPPEVVEEYESQEDELRAKQYLPVNQQIQNMVRTSFDAVRLAVSSAYKGAKARISGAEKPSVVSSDKQKDISEIKFDD